MAAEHDEGQGGNGVGLGQPPSLNPHAKPITAPDPHTEPFDTSGSVPPPSVPPPSAPTPPAAQPPPQAPAQPAQPAQPAEQAAAQQQPAVQPQPAPAPAQPQQPAVQPQAQPPAQLQLPAEPLTPPQTIPAQPPAAPVPQPITPMPPPPGWYGDIYGSPPRWWDGTVWTEHLLIPLPSAEPAAEELELNFFDDAVISFSLAPDWVKFLTAAVVAAAIALAAFTFIGDDSSDGDVPDGFVPQTPEFEEGTLPGDGAVPAPLPDDGIPR